MNFDELYFYYSNVFVPAYSDLTGYLLYKPTPVLHSIENALSHVMQCYNPKISEILRKENTQKAHHHLERATLDCYKILFVKLDKKITSVVDNPELRKFCVNKTEREFISQYFDFKIRIRDIREKEIENIGININETISLYKEAVNVGFTLIDAIDDQKISDYKQLNQRNAWIKTIRDFVIGVVTGLIACIIYGNWNNITSWFHTLFG